MIDDLENITQNFRKYYHGKLEKNDIDTIVNHLLKIDQESYLFAIAHVHTHKNKIDLTVQIENEFLVNGKKFKGHGEGNFHDGKGISIGQVYTNDVESLYNRTNTFYVEIGNRHTTIIFFTTINLSLHVPVILRIKRGEYEGTGITQCTGNGHGTGTWSN